MRLISLSALLLCSVALVPATVLAQEPVTPPVEQSAQPEPAAPVEPPIPEVWEPVPVGNDGASAYGLYLSGLLAGSRGDREAAADLFGEAELLTPEQPRVREAAFLSALFAGDLGVAARTTPEADAPPLRAGMSVVASIDTGHRRTLADLF